MEESSTIQPRARQCIAFESGPSPGTNSGKTNARASVQRWSSRPALRRILFATDFSACSLKVLPLLTALVRSGAVELYVVHLITPAAYKSIPCDSISWGIGEMVEDANANMAKLMRSEILTGIPIAGTKIAQGTAEELRKFVRDQSIDLLALGMRGSGLSHGSRLGTFVAQVVREAPCPLLLF